MSPVLISLCTDEKVRMNLEKIFWERILSAAKIERLEKFKSTTGFWTHVNRITKG